MTVHMSRRELTVYYDDEFESVELGAPKMYITTSHVESGGLAAVYINTLAVTFTPLHHTLFPSLPKPSWPTSCSPLFQNMLAMRTCLSFLPKGRYKDKMSSRL